MDKRGLISREGANQLLCIGDALVDFLSSTPQEPLANSELFRRCPGGSAVNTAIVAARLGLSTSLFTALGDDIFGDILCKVLQEEGVGTEPTLRVKGVATGLAFASSPRGRPEFYCLRSSKKAESELAKEHIPKLPSYVHLCSLLSCLLAPEAFVEELLECVKREKALLSYDPNIANGCVPIELVQERIVKCMKNADIVKMSTDDLAFIFPRASVNEAMDEILEMDVPLSIITHGKEGASVQTKYHRFDIPSFDVPVVDTVGAGDAFTGGLIFALSRVGATCGHEIARANEATLKEICLFASAVGAAACTTLGAHGGVKNLAQIESLLNGGIINRQR